MKKYKISRLPYAQQGKTTKAPTTDSYYTYPGSEGVYRKVGDKWEVDWNKSGNFQPLSKGDVKEREAALNKGAKQLYDKDYSDLVRSKQQKFESAPKPTPAKKPAPKQAAAQKAFDKDFKVTGKSKYEEVEDLIQRDINDVKKISKERGIPFTKADEDKITREGWNRYGNVYDTSAGPAIDPGVIRTPSKNTVYFNAPENPTIGDYAGKAWDIVTNPIDYFNYSVATGDMMNAPWDITDYERALDKVGAEDPILSRNAVGKGLDFASYFNPITGTLQAIKTAGEVPGLTNKAMQTGDWSDAGMAIGETALEMIPGIGAVDDVAALIKSNQAKKALANLDNFDEFVPRYLENVNPTGWENLTSQTPKSFDELTKELNRAGTYDPETGNIISNKPVKKYILEDDGDSLLDDTFELDDLVEYDEPAGLASSIADYQAQMENALASQNKRFLNLTSNDQYLLQKYKDEFAKKYDIPIEDVQDSDVKAYGSLQEMRSGNPLPMVKVKPFQWKDPRLKQIVEKNQMTYKQLSPEEELALHFYTGPYSSKINKSVYKSHPNAQLFYDNEIAPLLEQAITRHKLVEPLTVNRGVNDFVIPPGGVIRDGVPSTEPIKFSELVEGDEFLPNMFTSTTKDEYVSFGKPDLAYSINLPAGQSVLIPNATKVRNFPYENEAILPRHLRYKVKKSNVGKMMSVDKLNADPELGIPELTWGKTSYNNLPEGTPINTLKALDTPKDQKKLFEWTYYVPDFDDPYIAKLNTKILSEEEAQQVLEMYNNSRMGNFRRYEFDILNPYIRGGNTYNNYSYDQGGSVQYMMDDDIKKYRDAGYIIVEEPEDLPKAQDGLEPKPLQEVKVKAEPAQWVKDKNKFGKDRISWYESWNPKKWGLNDYSDYSSFNSAFRNARESGEKEFVYKGERYNTNLIPKEQSDLYWESKKFIEDYYKTQPYTKLVEDEIDASYDIQNKYIKKKYGMTWSDAYNKWEAAKPNTKEAQQFNKILQDINKEEQSIYGKQNSDFQKYLDAELQKSKKKRINERLKALAKPSYFSITSQKPKDMREEGYWDEGKNKTFMVTNSEPGLLNTTYVHELSHKGDTYSDVMETVPPINLQALNKSPYMDEYDQSAFDYLSDPTEIEARKLSTLFYLNKNKRPWEAGKITENVLDQLYNDYYDDKLPSDIGQLLMLYGAQRDDLLKYLNGDYNYNYKEPSR